MRIPALFLCIVSVLALGCGCPESPEQATTQPTDAAPNLSNFSDQIICDVLIKTMPDMEETDWRLTNVDEANRDQLLEGIFSAVKAGKLTAYAHPLGIPTRDQEWALAPAAFEAMLVDTLVQWVENPDNGEMVETVMFVETNPEDIFRLEFVEDWAFDPTTLRLEKTVTGMACLTPIYSYDTGEFRGNKKLFWVWFNDAPLLNYPA